MSYYATHKDRRYSDSSQYDEVCNICGLTDGTHAEKNMNNTPCTFVPVRKMHPNSLRAHRHNSQLGHTAMMRAQLYAITNDLDRTRAVREQAEKVLNEVHTLQSLMRKKPE